MVVASSWFLGSALGPPHPHHQNYLVAASSVPRSPARLPHACPGHPASQASLGCRLLYGGGRQGKCWGRHSRCCCRLTVRLSKGIRQALVHALPLLGGYTTNPGRDCSMGTCIWLAIWLAICMFRSICTAFPIVDCPTLGLPRLPHPALLDLQPMEACIFCTVASKWGGQPTRGCPPCTHCCTTMGSSLAAHPHSLCTALGVA